MAEALYRKYRPQVFSGVVGQDHVEQTLRNALSQDKLSHAYLFCGPRGTGKTTTARLLAKALLCQVGPKAHAGVKQGQLCPTADPCGECEDCLAIAAGEHPDVFELDAASRTGVENVREEIIGRVNFAPTRGAYKVYIIDEVHMLSTAAFNALLKTLEEPPAHVVFILCTTDPQKVPETIQSRCQRFDFKRISVADMAAHLAAVCEAEGVSADPAALEMAAARADGGMRNALTALEQIIAFGAGSVTVEAAARAFGGAERASVDALVELLAARDAAGCFGWVADVAATGADFMMLAKAAAERTRDMYVAQLVGAPAGDEGAVKLAASFGTDRLARMLDVWGNLINELKSSTNARLSFEIALTRLCRPSTDLTLEALAERIEALEAGSCATPVSASSPFVARPAISAVAPDTPVAPVVAPAPAANPATTMAQPAPAAKPQIPPIAHHVTNCSPTDAPRMNVAQPKPVVSQPEASAVSGVSAVRSLEAIMAEAPVLCQGVTDIPEKLLSALKTPSRLQKLWSLIFLAIKKEKQSLAAMLFAARPAFDESSLAFVIVLPNGSDAAFNHITKPENLKCLFDAVTKSATITLSLKIVLDAASDSAGTSASAAASSTHAQAPSSPAARQQAVSAVSGPASAPASTSASFVASVPTPAPTPASVDVPAFGSSQASVSASAPVSASASTPASAFAAASVSTLNAVPEAVSEVVFDFARASQTQPSEEPAYEPVPDSVLDAMAPTQSGDDGYYDDMADMVDMADMSTDFSLASDPDQEAMKNLLAGFGNITFEEISE